MKHWFKQNATRIEVFALSIVFACITAFVCYEISVHAAERVAKAEVHRSIGEEVDRFTKQVDRLEKVGLSQTNNNHVNVHPGADEIVSEAKRRLVDRGIIDE